MKKIFGITLILIAAGFCTANAQSKEKKDTTAGKNIFEKTANKTSEIVVKGKASIVDKVYKDKVGPRGQTIYIDHHSRYYWVDKKGRNVYIAKNKLRPKKD